MDKLQRLIIIGVTGPLGAGCSSISNYIAEKHNYQIIKLSDIIRENLNKSDASSKELQDTGDDLRKKNDNHFLAREALKKINFDKQENVNIIFDGIRNLGEVRYLRQYSDFYLISVDANQRERLKRYRKKTGEPIPDTSFAQIDSRDSGVGQPPYGQNVTGCVDLADYKIINEESWDENLHVKKIFERKINELLDLIKHPGYKRPTVREIGMHYAYSASLLSNCLKRKVGATIARQINEREEFIIAIGYNHPPGKIPGCEKLYEKCYRDYQEEKFVYKIKEKIKENCPKGNPSNIAKIFFDSEIMKRLDFCQSVHAEEAAILQVSKLGGMSIEGTTLYTTTFPCLLCAKKIIQSGIEKIVYNEPYPIIKSKKILEENLGEENIIKFEGVKSLAFFKLFNKNIY
jgi:deoxycytidylate deaminase